MTDVRPAATLRAHDDALPASKYVMPAEWERHDATWIAWPHHEPDWPGKLGAIPWVYAEIVRALHTHERVEILCNDSFVHDTAAAMLEAHDVSSDNYRLHIVPTDRVWLRDSAPTFVWKEDGSVALMNWHFNAWAKYDNYHLDDRVGEAIERISGLERIIPRRPDNHEQIILEGGGIDVNGAGRLLVTEEWLLSDIQIRNRGMTREHYNAIFSDLLGANETLWLGNGAAGDDTHGHIDDIARFASTDSVLLAFEQNEHDANAKSSRDNLRRLDEASRERPLRIVNLPYPRPVMMSGQRLPASYANFYIANDVVLVPTFNDSNDRVALDIIGSEFPNHEIIGIHSVDLVWGLGTLHCLTQQQPSPRGHGSSGDSR